MEISTEDLRGAMRVYEAYEAMSHREIALVLWPVMETWSMSRLSEDTGIEPNTLYRYMKFAFLDPDSAKEPRCKPSFVNFVKIMNAGAGEKQPWLPGIQNYLAQHPGTSAQEAAAALGAPALAARRFEALYTQRADTEQNMDKETMLSLARAVGAVERAEGIPRTLELAMELAKDVDEAVSGEAAAGGWWEEYDAARDPDHAAHQEAIDRALEEMWKELGDVPFQEGPDGGLYLEDNWRVFSAGTEREDIWRWFDARYSGGVYALLHPSAKDAPGSLTQAAREMKEARDGLAAPVHNKHSTKEER